jgi:hypothetical protein
MNRSSRLLLCAVFSMVLWGSVTVSWAAYGFVQGNSDGPGSPDTTIAVPFSSNVTAGNLIIAVVWANNAFDRVSGVADSQGNTYVRVEGLDNPLSKGLYVYYVKNVTGGANTVTATLTTSEFAQMVILEYSGLDTTAPLDKHTSATGNGTTLDSGATATTTSANEMVFGACNLTASTTFTATGAFAARAASPKLGTEDKRVTSTGTYNATFTSSAAGEDWACAVATFIESGGGGGGSPTGQATGMMMMGIGR